MIKRIMSVLCCLISVILIQPVDGQEILIEAESFKSHGGWSLDTQFIQQMGSPYLLAHGMGKPVEDAKSTIKLPEAGKYYLFVRTKDWVAYWKAPGTPGKFQVGINGKLHETLFGTSGVEWEWQSGGEVNIDKTEVEISLHDLTGFDGRCDAVYLSKTNTPPPNDSAILSKWRLKTLGLPEKPVETKTYDLVVVGGGYSGLGAAISAARSGCKVALIQDRGVLGGNGSSEVRVWAQGNIRRGKYPRIGEVIEELSDHAKASPGTYEEFEDLKKEKIVKGEKNIDLFLFHHAYQAVMDQKQIKSVLAFDVRTSERKNFNGRFFVDCTGHATLGYLAGADWVMEEKGRMGMSNMWTWGETESEKKFPETPWALPLSMKDFPYPREHHAEWFWESGFDKDPIKDAEYIRDWNFRATYGAFHAMKNGDGADKHKNAEMTWLAYVGGPRESRLLHGDVVLTQEDIVNKREFPDGCVPSTWSIDLHYPKKEFLSQFPDNPFISIAVHDRRVDRSFGYPIPYRCLYSKNITNLFMAGRCISVTHQALGTVRVMKTCGMMGEVVGKATSICLNRSCLPRDIAGRYWSDMDELLKLPGKAYRENITDKFIIPSDALPLADKYGPPVGLPLSKIPGKVIDDRDAVKTGDWHESEGLKGFIGHGYIYAAGNSKSSVTFTHTVKDAGKYEIRYAYQPHSNRAKAAPVVIKTGSRETTVTLDLSQEPDLEFGFVSLGKFDVPSEGKIEVSMTCGKVSGILHADAIQILSVKAE